MERGFQGYYAINRTAQEPFRAFVPKPLPPEPPLHFESNLLYDLIEQAIKLKT